MDVSELVEIIREDYLDDVFAGWQDATDAEKDDQFIWSDRALLRYITEAQRQACNRTDFLYDDTSEITEITLQAGVRDYVFSTKINAIEEVVFDDKIVEHISKEDRDRRYKTWRTDTGMTDKPVQYIIRGRKMFFHPMPDAVDAGKIVNLSIWHQPLDAIEAIDDELVIPEEFHRDLVWWVLYEAYSKQDADGYDKEKGLGYLAQFNQVFGEYVPSEVRLNQLQEPETLFVRPVSIMPSSNDRDEWYG